jgi:hypothetical protein
MDYTVSLDDAVFALTVFCLLAICKQSSNKLYKRSLCDIALWSAILHFGPSPRPYLALCPIPGNDLQVENLEAVFETAIG